MGVTLKQEVFRKGVIEQGSFTMEQQNEPNEPEHVVNISHSPMKHNKNLKDAYSTIAATILGVFQLIIGVVSFSVMCGLMNSVFLPFALPFVIFFVSGGIAIGGAQSGNKRLMITTMVMSIISALCSLVYLLYATLGSYFLLERNSVSTWMAVIPFLILLIMVIVPTISASLTCKPLCCQKKPTEGVVQPDQAHYYSNPVYFQPEQVHQVHYNPNLVSAANFIPNSGQALALNMNVQAQDMPPATGLTPLPANHDLVLVQL